MIFALLGPFVLTALVVLALPFLLVVGPALYAYRVTYEAGYGNQSAFGCGCLTFVYALIIVWRVHSSFGLFIGLVLVPLVIAWVVRAGRS